MKLTVTSAGGRTEALELGRQVVLGRDPACDVVLDDNLVSRRHAQLEVDDSGRMVLRDLGSRNGTFVNGQRIEGAVVLGGNERIGIGDAQISLAPEVAPAPPPDETDRMVGTTLGRYRIEAKIDEGAMGAVYLAEHTRLGKHVALKVMGQRLFRNQVARQRFVDESRAVASLDHPNIIPVFDADEIGDELFIAMRYVDGEDLGRLIDREGALDPERAISIVAQVGAALDAAHARGLIHRDVKPGNILIASARDSAGEGHAFLCDFGITKNLAASGLTATGQTLGTPNYMAPEQFKGQPVDGRTDLYALGCVLYECLTGRPPYPGDTFETVMYGHLATPPPPPTSYRPGLPPGLDAVLAKAMAKEPADRYATCADLVAAARAALASGTAAARTEAGGVPSALPTVVGSPAATVAGPPQPAAPAPAGMPPPPPGALFSPTVAEPIPGGVRGPGRPPGRSRRPLLIAVAVIVVVVVAVVAVVVVAGGGGGSGPATTIAAGPNGTVHDSRVTFRFRADPSDATFQCALDRGAFDRCRSPATFQGLDDGRHSLQVRAVASDGKTDSTPASRSWRVDDTTPPDTHISDGPTATSTSASATFSFSSSEEGSTFQCSLDGGSFQSCSSPDTVSGLPGGKHTFAVQATDAAGNTDASPATATWTVKVPFPTDAEQFLLDHVRSDLRPSCVRADTSIPEGGDAELGCTSGQVAIRLIHFPNLSDLDSYYRVSLTFAHTHQGAGGPCPDVIPTATTWFHTSTPNKILGNLLCYHLKGDSFIDWTYTKLHIYAYAFISGIDDKTLYDFWAKGVLLD